MAGSRTRKAVKGSSALLTAGLLLAGCANGQAGTSDPGTASSESSVTSPQAAGQQFDSVETLYTAVDDNLGCPTEASGEHVFMIESEPMGLPGRQCGTDFLVGWSDDPSKSQAALDILAEADGEVSAVQGPGWFVADVSRVAERAGTQPIDPDSTDLEALAKKLGASYGQL